MNRSLFKAGQGLIPRAVRLVEVGARDGLQNEKIVISAANKLTLIDKLCDSGLTTIEGGAFVSPKWVPQMADASEIFSELRNRRTAGRYPHTTFSALTPNSKGFEAALELGVQEVAVFGAASESFSRKNINCSVDESLRRFEPVARLALQHGVRLRGYVSCVLGCPYEGAVDPAVVRDVALKLLDMGCYEISLGDTIGVGNAGTTSVMLQTVLGAGDGSGGVPAEKLAVHFHDTYGQALSNVLVALQSGISVVDASVSGLGGCPYADGASGNVATEDVVYMLQGMGIDTGVDLDKLMQAGEFIDGVLQRSSQSKVATALRTKAAKLKTVL